MGPTKIIKRLGATATGAQRAAVHDYARRGSVPQQFRPYVKPRVFRRITGDAGLFQVDVMYAPYHTQVTPRNARVYVKYALVAVHVLSRKAFVCQMTRLAEAAKEGTQELGLLEALKRFAADPALAGLRARHPGEPPNLMGDNQFNSGAVAAALNGLGIKRVYTFVADHDHISPGDKLGIVNRFIGTLKRRMLMYVQARGAREGDARLTPRELEALLRGYNSAPHSSLPKGRSPDEVFASPALMAEVRLANARHNARVDALLMAKQPRVGQVVRHKIGNLIVKNNEVVGKRLMRRVNATYTAAKYKVEGRFSHNMWEDGQRVTVTDAHRYRLKPLDGPEGGIRDRAFKYHELLHTEAEEHPHDVGRGGERAVAGARDVLGPAAAKNPQVVALGKVARDLGYDVEAMQARANAPMRLRNNRVVGVRRNQEAAAQANAGAPRQPRARGPPRRYVPGAG